MSGNTVVAVGMVSFFLLLAVAIFADAGVDKIGIECVKAGNEWVRNAGAYECVRTGK